MFDVFKLTPGHTLSTLVVIGYLCIKDGLQTSKARKWCYSPYQKLLKKYIMTGSMSRKGNCSDNACIESFHGILKREQVYQTKYKTREEAKKSLFEYIEFFYNSKRIHSTFGYYTPNEFERMYVNSAA
jgi:putative transposase